MSEWMKTGCDECRDGVLSGMYSPKAAARQGRSAAPPSFTYSSIAAHSHLYRCQTCGAWWEFNTREAHVIAEEEAKTTFAEYFNELKQADR
jgi:hypothetical protein